MFSLILIRISDIVLTIILIIIFSPIFIILFFLIYFFSGLPIFYISKRIGYMGKEFTILKFRSIKNHIKEEPTFIGNIIRRTSLDELPQFFNILLGHMSLVGPRPLPLELEREINAKDVMVRRSIKPGLTGLAQINYTGKKRTWDDKIILDIEMINNFNYILYLKIIFLTLPVLIKRFNHNKKGLTL